MKNLYPESSITNKMGSVQKQLMITSRRSISSSAFQSEETSGKDKLSCHTKRIRFNKQLSNYYSADKECSVELKYTA